jgi:regulator of extracellular matrix RemA (YlzA/DUF370 family)
MMMLVGDYMLAVSVSVSAPVDVVVDDDDDEKMIVDDTGSYD